MQTSFLTQSEAFLFSIVLSGRVKKHKGILAQVLQSLSPKSFDGEVTREDKMQHRDTISAIHQHHTKTLVRKKSKDLITSPIYSVYVNFHTTLNITIDQTFLSSFFISSRPHQVCVKEVRKVSNCLVRSVCCLFLLVCPLLLSSYLNNILSFCCRLTHAFVVLTIIIHCISIKKVLDLFILMMPMQLNLRRRQSQATKIPHWIVISASIYVAVWTTNYYVLFLNESRTPRVNPVCVVLMTIMNIRLHLLYRFQNFYQKIVVLPDYSRYSRV